MIYHIVFPDYWAKFEGASEYFSETFEVEKFIHCSRKEQLAGVLERFFAGVNDLLIVEIDESKLTSPLLYEAVPDSEKTFPHIFGPINRAAIGRIGNVNGFYE
ncbi:DUF952 domain-containing protein [Runella sp.]|jgi:uncharacterized protein (DUF952 family)|uniref:DUF952 domain-containing protein n=1 Tax=Runella sp. TaxID=1960881 RepID=UPI00263335D7|nr:DUF952 domain-containing protein [Runella sp.]